MIKRCGDLFVDVLGRWMLRGAALAVALAGATAAWSQPAQLQPAQPQQTQAPRFQAPPPSSQQVAPPAAEQAPTAPGNPGLIEEIGKLLKDTASGLPSLPSPGQALDGLNAGAKDATDSLKRMTPLSGQTVATGRSVCPPAANGAPDCKAGADLLCKEKGYREGKSVDIESTQKCSAKAYFSGQGACQTENFVTRAVCQ